MSYYKFNSYEGRLNLSDITIFEKYILIDDESITEVLGDIVEKNIVVPNSVKEVNLKNCIIISRPIWWIREQIKRHDGHNCLNILDTNEIIGIESTPEPLGTDISPECGCVEMLRKLLEFKDIRFNISLNTSKEDYIEALKIIKDYKSIVERINNFNERQQKKINSFNNYYDMMKEYTGAKEL